ncbi:MAG: mechanosensitive ion channel family protein [Porticoccus sp.]|nr:mechanosensitive ion channel family protein [Porticoccus sp.]MBQ0808201.1 mechanosensitive ion channel family protein [Porticoccus sp.]
MQEEIKQFQAIYDLIVEFFVNYSFQLLGAVIVLLIGMIVAGRVARGVLKLCEKKGLDITLSRFIASFVKIVIIVGVAIISLGKLGISVTPFVAAIGAISLGAGLAAQGLLANYGAGLNIIITRPFVIGDTVTVQGETGLVDEVHMAFTVLKDEDDVRITIPNRHIVGEILHNSAANKLAETIVGVSYGSDPEKVIEVLHAVLKKQGVAEARTPLIGIDSFGDSGINFGVRFWIPTQQFHELRFATNNAIYNALDVAGITIPFPQREVRLLNETN